MNAKVRKINKTITTDSRINIWHKALVLALINLYEQTNCKNQFQISRRQIMQIAKIKSIATYHKYMKELQLFGYIGYTPSYHPMLGSQVYFKI